MALALALTLTLTLTKARVSTVCPRFEGWMRS